MVQKNPQELAYFVFGFPLSDKAWRSFAVRSVLPDDLSAGLPDPSYEIRKLADKINRLPASEPLPKDLALAAGHDGLRVHGEILLALRTINEALRWVSYEYFLSENPGCLDRCRQWAGQRLGADVVANVYQVFAELFPPLTVQLARRTTREFLDDSSGTVSGFDEATLEMVLLFMNSINPAVGRLTALFNDDELRRRASFIPFVTGLEDYLEEFEPAGSSGSSLFHLLRAPMLASPDSLAGQIEYIRRNWAHLLPPELMARLQVALDVLKEVDVTRLPDYGPPPVLEFGPGSAAWGLDEPEAYSRDADWMSNVVLMAKSTYVWLDQLSRWYGRPLRTLADIPDEELDKLARWGVTGLWLIGLWERSDASRRIKQYMGNPEAAASAYALRAYDVAADLGGREAYDNLRERAARRGIRLASDMVPNHMGIDSDWVINHPDWFLQLDRPPLPGLQLHRRRPVRTPPRGHPHRGRLLEPLGCGGGLPARGRTLRRRALHLPRQRRHQHALERHGPAQLPAARGPRGRGPGHPARGPHVPHHPLRRGHDPGQEALPAAVVPRSGRRRRHPRHAPNTA